jgi:hypothetical protein
MRISASGRTAAMFAAAVLVCFAAPTQAADGVDVATPAPGTTTAATTDTTAAPASMPELPRHASQHRKKPPGPSSRKIVPKPDDKVADPTALAAGSPAIAPSIANAKAQWDYAATPTGTAAKAMSARAANILANGAQPQPAMDSPIVAADQLNEVDKGLQPSSSAVTIPAATTISMARADAGAPAASSVAVTKTGSAWDKTSLIGKIFIGFGALLTMASAARMFMA